MKVRLAAPLQVDSVVDGEGIRTVLWFQGCPRQCKGCHNPETLDPKGGKEFSTDEIIEKVLAEDSKNITFSGGDPFNQSKALLEIAKALKQEGFNIWSYTGYLFEQIIKDGEMKKVLPYLDVLVDGPFIIDEKSLDVPFRGSRNQRLIDVSKTLENEKVVLYKTKAKPKNTNPIEKIYI